jgi:hypothetical protein
VISNDRTQVRNEGRQMVFGRFAAACGEVVQASDPGLQLTQAFANGVACPAEVAGGLMLAEAKSGDGLGQEASAFGTGQLLCCFLQPGAHLLCQVHSATSGVLR